LVCDIPAGDGKLVNLFLRCRVKKVIETIVNDQCKCVSFMSLDAVQAPFHQSI
jgi:hypothetical protein